jgi:hypothetical protein
MVTGRNNDNGLEDSSQVDRMRQKQPLLSGDMKGMVVKGGIALAAIALVILLLVMVSSTKSRARFILSDHELQDVTQEVQSQTIYEPGSKIHFLINRRNGKSLNASHFVMEIGREDGGKYGSFKQISYEIDKEFTKVSAYIPADYFTRKGNYMVKSYLDGKPVISEEIKVQ